MTTRRQDPSAVAIVMAMVAVAGFVLAIGLKLLGIVAQPFAVGFGSLAGTFRNMTVDLWSTSVVHPASATGSRHRLARRAEGGDTQAMRDLLDQGIGELQGGLATMTTLRDQLHSALPAEIQPGQAGPAKEMLGRLDTTLRSLQECYTDAARTLGDLYEVAIAIWEASGNGTTAAGNSVAALHAERSTITSLVQDETDRLTRVQTLVHAAVTAAQAGSTSGLLMASARSELIAVPSPDPWAVAITHLTDIPAQATAPVVA